MVLLVYGAMTAVVAGTKTTILRYPANLIFIDLFYDVN